MKYMAFFFCVLLLFLMAKCESCTNKEPITFDQVLTLGDLIQLGDVEQLKAFLDGLDGCTSKRLLDTLIPIKERCRDVMLSRTDAGTPRFIQLHEDWIAKGYVDS